MIMTPKRGRDISDDDTLVRYEKLAEEAPPYPSEMEIVPMDVPTNTWNTMHWINLVEIGVGNMENKSAYISVRFPYCTHGTRFQRV